MDTPEQKTLPVPGSVPGTTILQEEAETQDIIQALQLFRKHWKILLVTTIIGLTIAFLWVNFQKPVYRATASILIQEENQSPSPSGDQEISAVARILAASQPGNLDTQVRLLSSKPIFREACRRVAIRNPSEKPLESRVSYRVKENVSVVDIQVEHSNPQIAREVANKIGQVYIEYTDKRGLNTVRRALQFVRDQLQKTQKELRRVQEDLEYFKQRIKSPNLDADTAARLQIAFSTQQNIINLQAQLRNNEAQLTQLRQRYARLPRFIKIEKKEDNPQVIHLREELTRLRIERASMLKDYPEGSPYLQQMDAKIQETRSQLQQLLHSQPLVRVTSFQPNPERLETLKKIREIETQQEGIHSQIASLTTQLAQVRQQLAAIPFQQTRLTELLQRADSLSKAYMSLLEKQTELRMQEAAHVPSARLIEPAEAPRMPFKPRKRLSLVIGAFLGFILGLLGISLMASLDMALRTPDDVVRYLGFPTLALVPLILDPERRLISQMSARSLVGEGYRMLRNNLKFTGVERTLKSFLVTSAVPKEGKTLTASNLAIALAQNGLRTLLIDADLRNPSLHKLFNIPRDPGLTHLLVGDVPLQDILHSSGTTGLYIIASGAVPPNPAELLDSERMKAFLQRLYDQFDAIVLDTPPCSMITDAHILARQVDGVLIVTATGQTDRRLIARALDNLVRSGGRILGVVLNKVDLTREASYNYYYYHYYYYYGYGDSTEGEKEKIRRRSRKKIFPRLSIGQPPEEDNK